MILIIDIILIMSIISCNNKNDVRDTRFSDFPIQMSLVGKKVEFPDSDHYTVGSVEIAGDGYLFYTYKTDYYLLMTDSAFSNVKPLAYKGEGPDEFAGVSGIFGQALDSAGSLSIYDPYKICLYSIDPSNEYRLKEEISFSKTFNQYLPLSVVKNTDGKYIAIRGDNQYGMILYDPKTKDVEEWPLGYDFKDTDNPAYDVISFRSMAYCEQNGICAEIYGCFPTVILHDSDGKINGAYTYTEYIKPDKDNGEAMECFLDIDLTPDYIWLLYGDPDRDEKCHIFVLDYAGLPIADFKIESAMRIAIDARRQLIIAVNPRSDEEDAMVYKIPDIHSRL